MVSKLLEFCKSSRDIKSIELGNDYQNYDGDEGFEDHEFYTFQNLRITTKRGKTYTFNKREVWLLPKKEIPDMSQIFGFEINIRPDGKIEDCYFLTRAVYTINELKSNRYDLFLKLTQIKIDHINGKKTSVFHTMKNERKITERVS